MRREKTLVLTEGGCDSARDDERERGSAHSTTMPFVGFFKKANDAVDATLPGAKSPLPIQRSRASLAGGVNHKHSCLFVSRRLTKGSRGSCLKVRGVGKKGDTTGMASKGGEKRRETGGRRGERVRSISDRVYGGLSKQTGAGELRKLSTPGGGHGKLVPPTSSSPPFLSFLRTHGTTSSILTEARLGSAS